VSGRRRGRPTKTGDELTPREADTLAIVESAPDGITSEAIARILGVGKASTNTWLDELRRRDLVHSYFPEGASIRTPWVWVAGPASTGPVLAPMMCRALPSIFHAGAVCA